MTLPARILGRTGRASGLLLNVVPDGTRNPIVSGQTPTWTRATVGGGTVDALGRVSQTVHSQPKYEMVDLDGDGVRETMGLLIEQQRTNAFTYSQDFDNAAWTKGACTITANAVAAPDGSLTADKIAEDNTTANHQVSRLTGSLTASTYSSFSVFLKAGERTKAFIGLTRKDGSGSGVWYDLAAGTVLTQNSGSRGRIEKYADGWYRCIYAGDALTGATATQVFFGPTTTDAVTSYAGTTGSGIYAWGAQFETDKAYHTSYVPTVASTVTKNGDALTATVAWPWQDVTVYVKIARPWWADMSGDLGQAFYTYWLGGGSQRITMAFLQTTRNVQVDLNDGTTGVAASTAIPAGAVIEVCGQYANLLSAAKCRIDVGSGFGAYSAAVGAMTAQTSLIIGSQNSSAAHALSTPLLAFKLAAGARTMAEMRGLV